MYEIKLQNYYLERQAFTNGFDAPETSKGRKMNAYSIARFFFVAVLVVGFCCPVSFAVQDKRAPVPSKEDQQDSMACLLYTSPSPRDLSTTRMPSSA